MSLSLAVLPAGTLGQTQQQALSLRLNLQISMGPKPTEGWRRIFRRHFRH